MDNNKFEDLVLTSTFFRVSPGSESNAAQVIQSPPDNCHVYKFLGSYDLLRLELGTKLAEAKINSNIEGLLETSSIHASALLTTESTSSEFISEFESLCQYPIISLMFLQVRPRGGYPGRLSIQNSLSEECASHIAENNFDCAACSFLSYGKDDLLLLIGSRKFSDSFDLLKHLRNSRAGDLLDTTTHTAVSYAFLNDKDKLASLEEPVYVDIHVSCAPGSEAIIASAFSTEQYMFENLLGKEDLRILSKDSIPSGEAIKTILSTRENIPPSKGLFATTTYITNSVESSEFLKSCAVEISHNNTQQSIKRNQIVSSTLSSLEELRSQQKTETYFIDQCEKFLTKYRSASFSEAFSYLACDLDNCIEHELNKNIKELSREIRQRESILTSEKNFQSLTVNLTQAFAQRSLNLYDYRHGLPDLPQEYGQGVFLLSAASSNLVRQVYEIMEENEVGNGEWPGFIFFSQFMGFKAFLSSVFSLPSNALSSVLSHKLNWLTLSHEIAHDIWAEGDVFNTPRDLSQSLSFRDLVEGKGEPDGSPNLDSRYLANAQEMLGEWYAHWFDFTHFYSSDFEFFTWSIWSSWLRLPLVKSNLSEYFGRTLSVYVAHREGEYLDGHLTEDEMLTHTYKLFDELLELMDRIAPVDYDESHRKLIATEKDNVCKIIFDFLPFVFEFNRSCGKDEFKRKMKADTDASYQIIEQLSQGNPVKNHDNVFSVLIASMKWLKNNEEEPTHKFEFAFILTCLFARTRHENCASN